MAIIRVIIVVIDLRLTDLNVFIPFTMVAEKTKTHKKENRKNRRNPKKKKGMPSNLSIIHRRGEIF